MDNFDSLIEGLDYTQFRFVVTQLLYENLKRDLGHDNLQTDKEFNVHLFGSGLIDVFKGNLSEKGLDSYVFFRNDNLTKVKRIETILTDLALNYGLSSINFVSREPTDEFSNRQIRVGLEDSEGTPVDITFQSKSDFSESYVGLENVILEDPSKMKMDTWLAGRRISHSKMIGHALAKEWREANQRSFGAELNHAFKEQDIVLFLGSGVSRDAGGPTWHELIGNLRIRMYEELPKTLSIHKETRKVLCDALSNRFDPLIDAEQIWHGFESIQSADFLASIRKALYEGIPDEIPNDSKGHILSCIARFCKSRKWQGVRAVVTYNWDDLLEKMLDKAGIDFRVVANDRVEIRRKELPIYHVHGFLPKDRSGYPYVEEELPIVFKEREYHSLYRDPYHWSNHVQLQFLREHTCVFIGLSMTDPNLRRLLRISSEKHLDSKHYAHFKWRKAKDFIKSSVPNMVRNVLRRNPSSMHIDLVSMIYEQLDSIDAESIIRVQQDLLEQDLADLRVKTVWGRHHPCINRFLRRASGARSGYKACKYKSTHS